MVSSASEGIHVSLQDALAKLPERRGKPYAEVLRHGTMNVEIFAPRGIDTQTPHLQDELYFIIKGKGEFMHGSHRRRFGPGDVLFVPAGMEHRFEKFTDDLSVWVVFYGPEGGESPE
jgi:mannose-6-phosphate isomerase-like protein (cupin superfamily)